jgi:hypothetical protein
MVDDKCFIRAHLFGFSDQWFFLFVFVFIVSVTKGFLSPSLSSPTHLLRWVVQTDVAFYLMTGAQQKA